MTSKEDVERAKQLWEAVNEEYKAVAAETDRLTEAEYQLHLAQQACVHRRNALNSAQQGLWTNYRDLQAAYDRENETPS